jgi:hypothetical protein
MSRRRIASGSVVCGTSGSGSTTRCSSSAAAPCTRSACGSRSPWWRSIGSGASGGSRWFVRAGWCCPVLTSDTSWSFPWTPTCGRVIAWCSIGMFSDPWTSGPGHPWLYSVGCPRGRYPAGGAPAPPSSSGLGRRPFKAEARVRIPLGARFRARIFGSARGDHDNRNTTCARRGVRPSSPPCQGGDRGIEARRARHLTPRRPPEVGAASVPPELLSRSHAGSRSSPDRPNAGVRSPGGSA